MTDRPIIFGGPMVRALLAGRKSQTRRVLKPQPFLGRSLDGTVTACPVGDGVVFFNCQHQGDLFEEERRLFFAAGDRLWVRETHQFVSSGYGPCVLMRATGSHRSPEWTGPDEGAGPSYDYDRHPGDYSHWAADVEGADGPWRSPVHMPRWASRLTLIVTDVRVERLQDISEEDAVAEGLACLSKDSGKIWKYGIADRDGWPGTDDGGWPWHDWNVDPRRAYERLWSSIHGSAAWQANPWLVVVGFETRPANIDHLPPDALDGAGGER